MKNLMILVVVSGFGLAGCAMRQKVLDAGLVSMTQTHIPEGSQLESVGDVKGSFCSSMSNDKGSIGLFDEAVKSAQRQSKVDFIQNASFWTTGNGCVEVEGTGQRIVRSSTPATSTPSKKN